MKKKEPKTATETVLRERLDKEMKDTKVLKVKIPKGWYPHTYCLYEGHVLVYCTQEEKNAFKPLSVILPYFKI